MAKEYHANFCTVTNSRTDYSKNSLEGNKLIKAILIKKKSAFYIYNKVTACHLPYKLSLYYHWSRRKCTHKDIYVHHFIFPEELKNDRQ